MKGSLYLLFCAVLIATMGCQNNSEKLVESKISSIDNAVLVSQPYKSDKKKKAYYTYNSTIKNTEASSAQDSPSEIIENDLLRFSNLSDEVALSQLFSELSVPTQSFVINPAKDTFIISSKGTIIEIKAGSLVYANKNPVVNPVRFEVTEYLNKSEFFYANLSTNTNKGDLLESGGTLLLKAYSGKEEVFIAKGKSIQFQLPTNTIKENMELFSGIRDVHGTMKWNTMEKRSGNRVKHNRKNKTKEPLKSSIVVEENIQVAYNDGQKVYSKNYSNPDRNSLYKQEKLDTITVYFEIDENNIIKNSWSKRCITKGPKKGKPTLSYFKRKSSLNKSEAYHNNFLIKETEKLDITTGCEISSGFYTAEYFDLEKSWLKTKKEKKNRNKTMIVFMQRICTYSDTLEKSRLAEEELYLKGIENRLSSKSLIEIKNSELEYYIFNTTELGWINVDRFLHLKAPKGKFILEDKNLEKSRVSLIFKNYNAVLPGFVENGKVSFGHIPLGEEVTIVAIKMNKGIPMIYMQDAKTERGNFNQPIEFKAVSFDELQKEMKKINLP